MIEHFDSANGGITSIRSRISIRFREGVRRRTTRNRDNQLAKRETMMSEEERVREGANDERARRCSMVLRTFYSLNIRPNQTPSALRAREYKCSPSRLYNHGSVKLTSQSCNWPRNSVRADGRNPHPGHPTPTERSKIFAVPEFKSVSMRAVFTVDETFK